MNQTLAQPGDQPQSSNQPQKSYVDDYQPPQPSTQPQPSQPDSKPKPQGLETQDIFLLLGADQAADEAEKEAFLDELQQVIWEDFLENDVELLITNDEYAQLQVMIQQGQTPEVQDEMAVYLEKLIPDLEEIMVEKALELKEELVHERVVGMREHYADKPEVLTKIKQAEQDMNQGQWRRAAQTLNAISAE